VVVEARELNNLTTATTQLSAKKLGAHCVQRKQAHAHGVYMI